MRKQIIITMDEPHLGGGITVEIFSMSKIEVIGALQVAMMSEVGQIKKREEPINMGKNNEAETTTDKR